MSGYFNKKLKEAWWAWKLFKAKVSYGNPARRLKIIGITGTSGKTTTATLLYKIATALGYKAGLVSTIENIIAGEVKETNFTTPDSVTLTKLFGEMVKKGCTYVFMEVSSHSMEQKRTKGIPFIGGVFTNFSQDHLDYHKDMESYFQAKKKFFKKLSGSSFALSNLDDNHGERMLEGIQANPFTYGFFQSQRKIYFRGEIKNVGFDGLKLSFNDIPIRSRLLGKFNAYNLLAVWSTCSLLGFDMEKVNKILETIDPPRGRFEHFTSQGGVLAVVDYAHKPDALEKIFMAVREVVKINGRLISVFGCGGDRDALKRPIMGKIGAANSDIAIFTSDNPRSEDPEKIIEEMKMNLSPEELEKVKTIPSRREAILEATKIAKSGDVILCAGKGHENYQIIKGVKSHFDDLKELKKYLK